MDYMSEQINELAKALNAVQKKITGAKKDADNPFFKSKYADLESVWDACREPLTENGLSVTQFLNGEALVTMLLHSSGQWIKGEQKIYTKDNSPQAFGSAITYARRYGLAAIVGIVQVDDDGQAAQGHKPLETKANRVEQQIASKPVPPMEEIPYSDTPFPEYDNAHPLASYVIPDVAKRYKGKTFSQVPLKELSEYGEYMGKFLTQDGKTIRGAWIELLNNIDSYVKGN